MYVNHVRIYIIYKNGNFYAVCLEFLFISMHLMERLAHGECGVKGVVTCKAIYGYLEIIHYLQKRHAIYA